MTTTEIMESISIGFCQPKFYKRSVWNKAKKVMEFLCDNTDGEVVRHNFGPGMGKYTTEANVTERKPMWALMYKRSLGETISFDEAMPELKQIANELGLVLHKNTLTVLDVYFDRHPEDKKTI